MINNDSKWICTLCTYLNNKDYLCCEVCCSQKATTTITTTITTTTATTTKTNSSSSNKNPSIGSYINVLTKTDTTNTSINNTKTNNENDNNDNDNNNKKRQRINSSISTIFTSPIRHEKLLKNGSSLIVISNVLSQQQLMNFKRFYDSCIVIDESKGDGCYVEATNQGVLGWWKPNIDSSDLELKAFETNGKPWLLTNYNMMVSGGDTYKFIRSQKPTGFFTIDEMMNHATVYSRPAGVGGACTSSQKMPIELLDILETVKQISKCYFNGILVNVYPNGNVNINPHSDTEGRKSSIATLSFGTEREFVIREKGGNFKHTIHTQHNQLIIMNGSRFQETYTHEIAKDPNCKRERVSLTFRNHIR